MKCYEHQKDILGGCNWCGRPLCKLCIAKSEGKKIYCKNCARDLEKQGRTKIVEPKKEENKIKPHVDFGRGYFDFSSMRK